MTIQFRPNFAAYPEIMLSPGMQADLKRRTEQVQAAAERDASWDQLVSGEPGSEPIPYEASVERHGDRYVGRVTGRHPAALNVEAKHRVLGRAIDAAR